MLRSAVFYFFVSTSLIGCIPQQKPKVPDAPVVNKELSWFTFLKLIPEESGQEHAKISPDLGDESIAAIQHSSKSKREALPMDPFERNIRGALRMIEDYKQAHLHELKKEDSSSSQLSAAGRLPQGIDVVINHLHQGARQHRQLYLPYELYVPTYMRPYTSSLYIDTPYPHSASNAVQGSEAKIPLFGDTLKIPTAPLSIVSSSQGLTPTNSPTETLTFERNEATINPTKVIYSKDNGVFPVNNATHSNHQQSIVPREIDNERSVDEHEENSTGSLENETAFSEFEISTQVQFEDKPREGVVDLDSFALEEMSVQESPLLGTEMPGFEATKSQEKEAGDSSLRPEENIFTDFPLNTDEPILSRGQQEDTNTEASRTGEENVLGIAERQTSANDYIVSSDNYEDGKESTTGIGRTEGNFATESPKYQDVYKSGESDEYLTVSEMDTLDATGTGSDLGSLLNFALTPDNYFSDDSTTVSVDNEMVPVAQEGELDYDKGSEDEYLPSTTENVYFSDHSEDPTDSTAGESEPLETSLTDDVTMRFEETPAGSLDVEAGSQQQLLDDVSTTYDPEPFQYEDDEDEEEAEEDDEAEDDEDIPLNAVRSVSVVFPLSEDEEEDRSSHATVAVDYHDAYVPYEAGTESDDQFPNYGSDVDDYGTLSGDLLTSPNEESSEVSDHDGIFQINRTKQAIGLPAGLKERYLLTMGELPSSATVSEDSAQSDIENLFVTQSPDPLTMISNEFDDFQRTTALPDYGVATEDYPSSALVETYDDLPPMPYHSGIPSHDSFDRTHTDEESESISADVANFWKDFEANRKRFRSSVASLATIYSMTESSTPSPSEIFQGDSVRAEGDNIQITEKDRRTLPPEEHMPYTSDKLAHPEGSILETPQY